MLEKTKKVGNMRAVLRAKHQITLPSAVVKRLNLREGDELFVALEDDRAILRPVRRTYRGVLKGEFKSPRDIAAFLRSERDSWPE